MPRIAACLLCAKIERLIDPPDDVPRIPAKVTWHDMGVERSYTFTNEDGTPVMVPEVDPLLEDFVGRHKHNRPDSDMGTIKVFPVEQRTWDRMDVVTEIKKDLASLTGMIFEESTHYRDNAAKCYQEHGSPTTEVGCRDFMDDSKRIGPKTKPKYQAFLCHMCPYYQSYVMVELRRKKGWYDPKNHDKLSKQRDRALGIKK